MIKENLRILREQNGLTQAQVANVLQISRSTYTYYEMGRTKPDINTLKKLGRLYDISMDTLMEYSREKSSAVLHDNSLIYTSNRLMSELNPREQNLLMAFRLMGEKEREKIMDIVQKNLDAKKKPE